MDIWYNAWFWKYWVDSEFCAGSRGVPPFKESRCGAVVFNKSRTQLFDGDEDVAGKRIWIPEHVYWVDGVFCRGDCGGRRIAWR